MEIDSSKSDATRNCVRVLIKIPVHMRRNLKIVAALAGCSLNDKIIEYITSGLKSAEKEILSNPDKIMNEEG